MKHLSFSLLVFFTISSYGQNTLKQYLALGDSYTIGESVEEDLRWPNQLVEQLNQKEKVFDRATIIAKTGWTTDELLEGIKNSNLKERYDYVSLLIGVNNQYRGRSQENFKAEFTVLLEKSIALAGGKKERVFVLSIPDWGVMPFAKGRNQEQIGLEIDQFNVIIKKVCALYAVSFYDITPISRRATNQTELIASDGLHPSGKMYSLWVEQVVSHFN